MTCPGLLKRYKVDFTPDEAITHLAAGRNQVTIATKDRKIFVIETQSSKQTDCDLDRYLGNRLLQARVHKIFVDPTGEFILISLAQATDNQPMENLLFVKRLQPLPRLKGHIITAVAWNYPRPTGNSDSINSTGTILLGTSKGLVLQTELIHTDETRFFPLSPGPRQYVKEVFDAGQDVGPITGIEYHQVPSNSQTEKSFVIIFSTNNRLYRMSGNVSSNVDPPPLHLIFAQNSAKYQEVPGRFNNGKIDFFYPSPNSPPTRFAWLTEPGVLTGEINHKTIESNDEISIVPYNNSPNENSDQHLLLSSSTPSGMSPPFSTMSYYYDKPISVVVTNFHVVVLSRFCIKAICVLNDATVYEEYFSTKYGSIQGMCKDPVKNIIWVYCERAVIKYKMLNENKNVWKIFLEQRRFDLAKKFSIDDGINYDRVICEEAQHYFRQKEYEKSAEIYARSQKPFEEVALMFMEIGSFRALKKYLMIRLEQFDPIQMTQMTMTLAWLMDMIISSISIAKTRPENEKNIEELDNLYNEMEQLLENKQIVECLIRYSQLFYGIIRNHSDLETFVRVAKLIGDYEHVVQYYMDLGKLDKALEIMKNVKKNDYFYKYGHILMKRLPREFVDALIEQPTVKPSDLIPILIQENPYFNKCSETIRYLEHCVRILKTDCKAIHNYLFELYARHRDEDTLIEYLNDEAEYFTLDYQLCLRLCTELKLVRACVALYSSMELYDEALNLALEFDIDLAKSIAKRVECEDHQKRLWLVIARNMLTKKCDIQVATKLLQECRLLKIEDILPFFPDYTTIDFFKDAIRQSLQEYKDQIMTLKDGTYDIIADEIRGEIKAFRSRYSIIKSGQRCESCSHSLLTRTFYVFPCGHLFHADCLVKVIISINPTYKSGDISSQCVYCGSLLLNFIDKSPSVDSDED